MARRGGNLVSAFVGNVLLAAIVRLSWRDMQAQGVGMARGLGLVALFVALLGISILSAPSAHADFGNCNDPGYLSKFDERFAGSHDFLCTEIARFSVASDAGTSHIRVIQHLNADWAGEPGSIAALVHGVEAAAAAMPRLGHFRLQDVTVLLVDGWALTDRREVWDGFGGYTDFTPGSECHVTLYLLGPAGTTDYAANVAAHELFHCVQRASLSQAQMDTSNGGMPGGGTWWVEGSAEWFTTLACRRRLTSICASRVSIMNRRRRAWTTWLMKPIRSSLGSAVRTGRPV